MEREERDQEHHEVIRDGLTQSVLKGEPGHSVTM